MKRGFALMLAVLMVMTLVAGCARSSQPADTGGAAPEPVAQQPQQAETPKEQVTIRILALNWPQAAVEQKLADSDFTPKTGIKVVLETNQYDVVEQKMKQVILSKDTTYDIVHYDSQWLGQFVMAGGLERLDTPEYLNSPNAQIKFADFNPSYAIVMSKYPTNADDVFAGNFDKYRDTPIYGLPWATGSQIMMYRKDKLEAAGYTSPPETWEEYAEAAKKMTGGGFYGAFTHAGRQGDYLTQDFFPILWANGGALWDPETWQFEGILNSDKNVQALQFYVDWNLKLGIVPPESANWGNEEVFNGIAQDKVGIGQLWGTFAPFIEDPNNSKASGKMGYYFVPGFKDPATGEIRRAQMYGSQATGITTFSQHKQEAWQYLQWLLSRETQLKLVQDPAAAFVSSRLDLEEETIKANPWSKYVLEAAPITHDFFNTPDYAELLSIVQRELNLAFVGLKSPKQALDDAAKAMQLVADTSPYNPKKQ